MTIQKKIANKIKEKKGLTLIGILLGAVAFGLLAFPMARWVMSMTQTVATHERKVADIGIQLEMQSVLEDRWHIINDMSIDQLKAATTKTTTYGKYSVKEEYKAAGKYNASTGACAAGTTPSSSEQLCREVTMTVTGPAGTTPLGPVVAIRAATPSERMAALETKAANLETKVAAAQSTADTAKANAATAQSTANTAKTNAATAQASANAAQSTANTANSNANSALSKFGSYYTKSETYKKSEVDSKVSSSSTSGINGTFLWGPGWCDSGYRVTVKNGVIVSQYYEGDHCSG